MKHTRLIVEIAVAFILLTTLILSFVVYVPGMYTSGYSNGSHDGYKTGFTHGYSNGYIKGDKNGNEKGYAKGYNDGLSNQVPNNDLSNLYDWITSSCVKDYQGYYHFVIYRQNSDGTFHYTCLV